MGIPSPRQHLDYLRIIYDICQACIHLTTLMKRLIISVLAAIAVLAGCSKHDDVWYTFSGSQRRGSVPDEKCQKISCNINALQTILKGLQEDDFITSITCIKENGIESGYWMSFIKNGEITIYDIPEEDTPLLTIEEGYWQVSFDDGATWNQLVQAGDEEGLIPIFKSVTFEEGHACMELIDGTTLTVPMKLYANDEIVLSPNDFIPAQQNSIRTGLISARSGNTCSLDLNGNLSGKIVIHSSPSFIDASDWVQKTEYVFPFDCNFYVILKRNDGSSIMPADFDSKINIHRTPAANSNVSVQDHFKAEILETIASVQKVLTEPYLMFAMVSDIHYMASSELPNSIENTTDNIVALSNVIGIDFISCLGDSVEGNTPKATTSLYCDHILEQFAKTNLPYYPCIGNHDDNRYCTPIFSHSELHYNYLRNTTGVVWDQTSMCGTNYYKDFEEFGIRCIFLNANTNGSYGYSADTCDWFEKVVDRTPGKYIVFTHVAPIPSLNYGFTQYGTDSGSTRIREKCIKTSGKFIGMFCGHNHYDAFVTDPFLCVCIHCQKFENENGDKKLWATGAVNPSRRIGDATEDCFDIVVVRPQSGKINRIRFGAGEDQEYMIGH